MSESNRQSFVEQNKHLWGKVDPIDGIAYRPPVEPRKQLPQAHDPLNLSIYEESDRPGLTVRVRWRGVLHYVGSFPTVREARQARDDYRAKLEATRHECPHCGEVWHDGEAEPTDCCLFALLNQAGHQAELAEA